jgi:hypothetical protein
MQKSPRHQQRARELLAGKSYTYVSYGNERETRNFRTLTYVNAYDYS